MKARIVIVVVLVVAIAPRFVTTSSAAVVHAALDALQHLIGAGGA
jgi:hypothetical protein